MPFPLWHCAINVLCTAGLAVRMPITFLAMSGAGLSIKERLFVACAWTPKATVQAAVGAQPLDTIIALYGAHAPDVAFGEVSRCQLGGVHAGRLGLSSAHHTCKPCILLSSLLGECACRGHKLQAGGNPRIRFLRMV